MISVTITDKDGTSTRLTFDKNEMVIGRVNGNDIVLPKVNVTKRHARIVKMTGKTVLIDMKSREGIFVNGYRISNPCQLYEGDKFFIGDYTLEVHEPDKNAPPPLDPDVVKVFNAYFNIPNSASPKPNAVTGAHHILWPVR